MIVTHQSKTYMVMIPADIHVLCYFLAFDDSKATEFLLASWKDFLGTNKWSY